MKNVSLLVGGIALLLALGSIFGIPSEKDTTLELFAQSSFESQRQTEGQPSDTVGEYCSLSLKGDLEAIKEIVMPMPDMYVMRLLKIDVDQELDSETVSKEAVHLPSREDRISGFKRSSAKLIYDSLTQDYPSDIRRFQFKIDEIKVPKIKGTLARVDARLENATNSSIQMDLAFFLYKDRGVWKIFKVTLAEVAEDLP